VKETRALSPGRNDFVHAVFLAAAGPSGLDLMAMRTSNSAMRPLSDIAGIRDQAAKLSHRYAHVALALVSGTKQTPFQDKWG
jgi:hypothetical protein